MGELLDVGGAARMLGLSHHSIYNLVSRRRIPFVRMPAGEGKQDRTLRFDPAALEAWVFDHSVKPEGVGIPA